MASPERKDGRGAKRIFVSLPIHIEEHDAHRKVSRELTHSESVSEIGAGFFINRLFEVGQAVLLKLPLAPELRRYSFDADLYEVWAVVRHCHRNDTGKAAHFHIGVAFIGDSPPPGYYKNPKTIYVPTKLKGDGFWEVTEIDKMPSTRRSARYDIPLEIYIAVFDSDENIVAHERTVTENISETGASVFSELELKIGDDVRIIKQQGGFSAKAIVRNRRIGKDNLPRLHLEFVNVKFPLDGID